MKLKKQFAGLVAALMTVTAVATPLCDKLPIINSSTATVARAEGYGVYGYFECYVHYDGTVSITDYLGSEESVVIPAKINGMSVTSIGEEAFYNHTSLKGVTIPNSVKYIGYKAFYNCSSLTSIEIPESVTSIGSWAFSSCDRLTSITIPNGVTSIGSWAFYGCRRLENITISDSVISIGDDAFSRCSNLRSITIPDSVTSIGSWAFSSCDRLTSITIPDSVTSIGYKAFFGCTNLIAIDVAEGNENYVSVNGILFNKDKTELICYPTGKTDKSYIIPNGVTSIDDYAFYNCPRLTSITIPDSLSSIGKSSFAYCNLKSITIPDGVISIETNAFYDCTSLTTITIPASVTYIGAGAFGYYLSDLNGGKIDGFKIYCYKGTAGEQYAKENGFDYEVIRSAPSKVIGLTFGARSADYVSLKWDKDDNADGYIVEYLSGDRFVKLADKASGSAVSHKITGLNAGTLYKFRVRSYQNVSGKRVYGEYSDILKVRTLPTTMSGLTLGARTDNSITLKWDKNESANGAIVEMYDGTDWVTVATKTSNTAVSHKITGLKASTAYKFRVRAYINDEGGRIYSVYNLTLNEVTAPSTVTNFRNTIAARTALRFNWDKNTTADGYYIEMVQDGKWVQVTKIESNATIAYAQLKLNPETKYTFRIRAYKQILGKTIYGAYSTIFATTAK